ncbi:MAG: putative rane protein TadG/TadE -like protein [Glaciihabitans sp.]|nr:putative rane protein TadG/TadE -like protein [Glaciihabitans sp.]
MYQPTAHNDTSGARSRRLDRERGSASLENIIIWPVVLLFIFGFFQAAMWFHARDVAHAAATAAFYEARLYNGSAADGTAQGYESLGNSGTVVANPNVLVTRSATTVVVTVTGNTAMVARGWPGSALSETVSGPVERYIAP